MGNRLQKRTTRKQRPSTDQAAPFTAPPTATGLINCDWNPFDRWRKNFFSYVSRVENRPIDKAFNKLCVAGCNREQLLLDLWGYSSFQLNPVGARTLYAKTAEWVWQFRDVARTLQQAVSGVAKLKKLPSEHGVFITLLDNMLYGGKFAEHSTLMSGIIKFYASHWSRKFKPRQLASNNFLLLFLCENVKLATGRPYHKEIALSLEAAFAAHSASSTDWTADMLAAKLRRIPRGTRNVVAYAIKKLPGPLKAEKEGMREYALASHYAAAAEVSDSLLDGLKATVEKLNPTRISSKKS